MSEIHGGLFNGHYKFDCENFLMLLDFSVKDNNFMFNEKFEDIWRSICNVLGSFVVAGDLSKSQA